MAESIFIVPGFPIMSNRKNGLEDLHQRSLNLLYQFATSAQDAARYNWEGFPQIGRVTELTKIIKRDLTEFQTKLNNIKIDHQRKITSAVLNDPNHPVILRAGGDYYDFIDQVTNVVSPHAGELMDLIRELAASEKKTA